MFEIGKASWFITTLGDRPKPYVSYTHVHDEPVHVKAKTAYKFCVTGLLEFPCMHIQTTMEVS